MSVLLAPDLFTTRRARFPDSAESTRDVVPYAVANFFCVPRCLYYHRDRQHASVAGA